MPDIFLLLRDFLDTGGDVLWLILALTITLWWLILDRAFYLIKLYPGQLDTTIGRWQTRDNKTTWYSESMRKQWISELDCALSSNMKMIPSLIALLPMLGLLGTVTGMIQVFDVLAINGASNPRSMADGVSAATIPTMSGMVSALTAMPVAAALERRYKKELHRINAAMPSEWSENLDEQHA